MQSIPGVCTTMDEEKNGLNLKFDGNIGLTKRKVWNLVVAFSLTTLGGSAVQMRVENNALRGDVIRDRARYDLIEAQSKKSMTDSQHCREQLNDVLMFFAEERARQTTAAGRKRYDMIIKTVQDRMKGTPLINKNFADGTYPKDN